ncbi:Polynucleotide 5'-hydroxyl-kinase grc3 [Tulasnella sp. 403]|nr:Polynucleotide 5'-hydroxyl-kinase grc3 [Tulasnella sp. 403]
MPCHNIQVTRPEGQLYAFAFPSDWQQAIEQALESLRGTTNGLAPLVALIKGPRKVGKSTFSRILLNRLTRVYRQVAYLECDLGQAEFSPSGMVSLHVIKRPIFGPPFSHLQWPIAAHYIGSDSPRSSPHHYISAIAALLQTHKSDIQYAPFEGAEDLVDKRNHSMTPLVINTSGWTRGMGGDLLRQIQELARPTHIFDIDGQRGPGHEELGPGDRTSLQEIEGATVWTDESFLPRSFNSSCSQAAMYRLRPFNPPPSARVPSPAELRALCIMSYFYGRPSDEGMTWRVNRSLVAIPPYQVDVTVAFDAVILTGSGAEDVVVEEVLRTLACSIVGLVESTAQGDSSRTSGFPYIQGRGPPDPWTSRCLGLGFIRGISSSAESTGVCIHLLTPLPPSVFRRCRVMVKGELEMSIWAFMDRSEEERPNGWGVMPYLTHNSGAAAVGSKTKTRKNVLQRGYR